MSGQDTLGCIWFLILVTIYLGPSTEFISYSPLDFIAYWFSGMVLLVWAIANPINPWLWIVTIIWYMIIKDTKDRLNR